MGVGKSKIIADAINLLMDTTLAMNVKVKEIPILILVSSTYLRDKELPLELQKWGCKHKVTIACYQSAYKWNKKIGLLVADEMDFALSKGEKYTKTFVGNSFDYFLGLTGTIIGDKVQQSLDVFNKAPFFMYPVKQAQIDGVLNKTMFWIHEVPLYTEASVNTPKGEHTVYNWIESKISYAKSRYQEAAYSYYNLQDYSAKSDLEKWRNISKYWQSSGGNPNSRLKFLRSADSLIAYAIKLKQRILEKNETHKVLIFSELTNDVDRITMHRYHGKANNIASTLQKFNSGELRELGVVKKVNRGVNFDGLNNCIVQSFSSSLTNAHQAFVGRLVRLPPNEIAHIHILVSYYYDDAGRKIYTKNKEWADEFLESVEFEHMKKVIYNKGL